MHNPYLGPGKGIVKEHRVFRGRPGKGGRILQGLAAGVFMACLVFGLSPEVPAQEKKPIRIGATISLSGKYLEPSAMIKDGMKLWAGKVNARGGLLGRPVELVLYDDQSRPELVRKLYRRLILQDKVDLVLSPYSTPLTMAASEVTERYRFVMLSSGAAGESLWERGYRYIFGVYAPSRRYLIGFLDLIARQGLEAVAILYEKTPFNNGVAQGGREWARRLGIKVSYFEEYQKGQTDIPRLLPAALATKPEALILCSYPGDSYALLALLSRIASRPRVLCLTIAPALPDFYRKAGKMAEGVFGPSQWEPDNRIPFPGTKEFIESFKNLAHRPPSYHAGSAYAACQILERGIIHNRSLNQDKLRDYIYSLDTVTIIGRFRVDNKGMQVGHNPILIQWQKGKKEIVYPTSMQTAEPRF